MQWVLLETCSLDSNDWVLIYREQYKGDCEYEFIMTAHKYQLYVIRIGSRVAGTAMATLLIG